MITWNERAVITSQLRQYPQISTNHTHHHPVRSIGWNPFCRPNLLILICRSLLVIHPQCPESHPSLVDLGKVSLWTFPWPLALGWVSCSLLNAYVSFLTCWQLWVTGFGMVCCGQHPTDKGLFFVAQRLPLTKLNVYATIIF